MLLSMKLIVITAPNFFVEEDKILTSLFDEGLEYLHLRKPNSEPMFSERLLTLIPEHYHKRIVTHDHFYLKEEFNLMGIHLSSRHPFVPQRYKGHVSCSCHSVEEVKEQKKEKEYVFMSPIFDSISKKNYFSTYSPEVIREAAREGIIDRRVIALGGIDADNIDLVKDYGFGGAAVLGDLWERFDPRSDRDYEALLTRFRTLKRLAD